MNRLAAIIIFLGISQICFGQSAALPYFQCGSHPAPLVSPIKVWAKPLEKAGSIGLPMIVDNETLGFMNFTTYRFQVLQSIEGFCPDTLVLAIEDENDTLLHASTVLLEVVEYYNENFAALSEYSKNEQDIDKHIKREHGNGHSFFGQVERIAPITEHFKLSDFTVEIEFPDSTTYGFDTATIHDTYFKIEMKTTNGVQAFYSRVDEMLNTPIFEVGESYLFRYHIQDQKKWIDLNNLYRKNYHINAYFEAYQLLR